MQLGKLRERALLKGDKKASVAILTDQTMHAENSDKTIAKEGPAVAINILSSVNSPKGD